MANYTTKMICDTEWALIKKLTFAVKSLKISQISQNPQKKPQNSKKSPKA